MNILQEVEKGTDKLEQQLSGFFAAARERKFSDDKIIKFIIIVARDFNYNIIYSQQRVISEQANIIQNLIGKDKDKFLAFIEQCLKEDIEPRSLLLQAWEE